MMDPNLNQKDKFGIQGSVGFSKTHPNLNTSLYSELKKFIAGNQGLAGSGGHLANRLDTPEGYQQSNVFDSNATRQRVQKRLEQQLTEYLSQAVGPQAKQQGMSIPAFLRSQGIRGIKETGRGASKRLTAYSPDQFMHVSQNPITGSTEKMARAFMKNVGAVNQVSGGTNERRRLEAYLRPDQAEFVNDMIQNTAYQVNAGVYPKGDMEPLYGTEVQRMEAKSRHKTLKNDLTAISMESRTPATVEEVKSKMLKQNAEKQLYKQAETELRDTGQLAPLNPLEDMKKEILATQEKRSLKEKAKRELREDGKLEEEEAKGKKQSPASVAAKGVLSIFSVIGTTVKSIKNLTGLMLGFLKEISRQVGRIIGDASETGISPEKASLLFSLGNVLPLYTGGNKYMFLDSLKTVQSKYGDVTKLERNQNFDTTAYHGYGRLIKMAADVAVNQDPFEGMRLIYNTMATDYANTDGEAARRELLKNQRAALTGLLDGNFASGYGAMINYAEAEGMITKETAPRFFEMLLSESHLRPLSNGADPAKLFMLNSGTNSPGNYTQGAKDLNSVLADWNKLQQQFLLKLMANMDLIKNILNGMLRLVLSTLAAFGHKPSQQALDQMNAADDVKGKKGFHNLQENSMKFRQDAENRITNYLKDQGVSRKNIPKERKKILAAIYNEEELPSEYKSITETKDFNKLLASIGTFKHSQQYLKDISSDVFDDGEFPTQGHAANALEHAGGVISNLYDKYGYKGRVPGRNYLSSGIKLSQENKDRLNKAKTLIKKKKKVKALGSFDSLGFESSDPQTQQSEAGDEDIKKEKEKGLIDKVNDFFSDSGIRSLPDLNINQIVGGELTAKLASLSLPAVNNSFGQNVGLKGSNDPFEMNNRVDIFLNNKQIASNSESYSEASRRRSYQETSVKI